MRKPLLIIATLGLLVGLFAFYLMYQPAHKVVDRNGGQMSSEDLIPPSERPGVIGPVKEGLIRNFDQKTGQLTWQFQADEYTPQADGRVLAQKPEAVFFLKNEQMIRIRGVSGLVTMPQSNTSPSGTAATFRPSNSPPSRGDLKQVRIDFFASQQAMDLEQPQLFILMDNVAFDTETFRIFTESAEIDGKTVPGELIPVIVRGRDYDFDGSGLMIRWNERDRRLELLQILHGNRLVVKDPRLVRGLSMQGSAGGNGSSGSRGTSASQQIASGTEQASLPSAGAQPASPSSASATPAGTHAALPAATDSASATQVASAQPGEPLVVTPLASPDPNAKKIPLDQAVVMAATSNTPDASSPTSASSTAASQVPGVTVAATFPTSAPSTRPLPQVYQAKFDRDVRILQDGVDLVDAEMLLVDFTFDTAIQPPADSSGGAASATMPAGAETAGLPTPMTGGASPGGLSTSPGAAQAITSPDTAVTATGSTWAAAGEAPVAAHPAEGAAGSVVGRGTGDGPKALVPTAGDEGSGDASAGKNRGPIVILWSGELRVTPLPEDAPRPTPGGAVVRLVGSPLKLVREGRTLECGQFSYDTASEEVTMLAYKLKPLELSDDNGLSVHAASLKWQTRQNILQFPGGGQATLPMSAMPGSRPADPKAAQLPLIVNWSQNCRLEMAGNWQSGVIELRKAILNGDVVVDSPELHLKGQSLAMDFVPDPTAAASMPAKDAATGESSSLTASPITLERVVASGGVLCDISTGDNVQKISGDYLELSTGRNDHQQLYPRQLQINGKARLVGGGSEMSAGNLKVVFEPLAAAALAPAAGSTTQPMDMLNNLAIQSLRARDGVNIRTADGAYAIGDQLDISGSGDAREISLLGDSEARVSDGNTVFSGPSIVARPNQQMLAIVGPGTLQAMRTGTTQTNPITIEWKKSAILDGRKGSGEVLGGVTVSTQEKDGTVSGITSDKAILELAKEAADPKSGRKNSPSAADVRNAHLLGIQPMGMMAVSKVTFVDHATVQSLLTDADGNLLRRLTLLTDHIAYNVTGGQMIAPGPGQLLYEDHRPTEGQAKDAIQGGKIDSSRLRGATAMKWDGHLSFDRASGQIVLDKNVLIVHEPDEQKQSGDNKDMAWRMEAQKITATLASQEDDGNPPAESNTNGVDAMARMTLRKINADAQIVFKAKDVELTAGSIEFDPVTGRLSARGTDRSPVEVRQGLSPGNFSEVIYNVRKQRIELMRDVRGRLQR